MRKAVMLFFCGALVLGLCLNSADATKPFSKVFKAKYINGAPVTSEEKALAEAVATVKCNVCHVGKKKKQHNAYGNELSKLLEKKKDAKNIEKVERALDTVGALQSPNGGTYGERLAAGKLPISN